MTRARDLNPVRICRERQGMLLVELAQRTHLSPALISMCEGGFVPKLKTMLAIADALGSNPLELWPDEVEEINGAR